MAKAKTQMEERVAEISKRLKRSELFSNVGLHLRECMIAHEVMNIQRQQFSEDQPIRGYNVLYDYVRVALIPEMFGEAGPINLGEEKPVTE